MTDPELGDREHKLRTNRSLPSKGLSRYEVYIALRFCVMLFHELQNDHRHGEGS